MALPSAVCTSALLTLGQKSNPVTAVAELHLSGDLSSRPHSKNDTPRGTGVRGFRLTHTTRAWLPSVPPHTKGMCRKQLHSLRLVLTFSSSCGFTGKSALVDGKAPAAMPMFSSQVFWPRPRVTAGPYPTMLEAGCPNATPSSAAVLLHLGDSRMPLHWADGQYPLGCVKHTPLGMDMPHTSSAFPHSPGRRSLERFQL